MGEVPLHNPGRGSDVTGRNLTWILASEIRVLEPLLQIVDFLGTDSTAG